MRDENTFSSLILIFKFSTFNFYNPSTNFPNSITFLSFRLCHIICIHIGISSPRSFIVHIGTDIAGSHAILAGIVYISSRYICRGSADLSHIFHATLGTVGVSIISYWLYMLSISCISLFLAF